MIAVRMQMYVDRNIFFKCYKYSVVCTVFNSLARTVLGAELSIVTLYTSSQYVPLHGRGRR